MRGAGVAGAVATSAAGGRGGATGGATDDALIGGAPGGPTIAGGGAVGRGRSAMGGGTTTGFSTIGAATTERCGAGATGGTTGGGGAGFATGGATTGLAAIGGCGAGRAGGVAASFCCVIAFSTSPGREMCDRSILVLISSSPRTGRAVLAAVAGASAAPRMWARTFSASCSSRELECVFFSVTPTSGSTSRMALLLTSSSLARSLIRTLLIRPFLYSVFALSLHRSLTEFSSTHPRSCMRMELFGFFRSGTVFRLNNGFRLLRQRSFFRPSTIFA